MATSSIPVSVWRKYNRRAAGTQGAHTKRQYRAVLADLEEDEQNQVAIAIVNADYAHKWVSYELKYINEIKARQAFGPWVVQFGHNASTAGVLECLIRARVQYLRMAGDLLVVLQDIGASEAVQRLKYGRMAKHVNAVRHEQEIVASISAPDDEPTKQRLDEIRIIQQQTSRLKNDGWTYHGLKPGGQGEIGVWVRGVDGRIIDRMVVKDTHYSKPEDRHLWTNHLTWAGDLDDLVNRKLMEVEVMELLQAAQADCILRLRGKWRVFEEKMMYKTYTEWCPYKTLQHLIDEETEEDSSVNEPLAWWIFKNLVDMGLLMEQGSLDTLVPGWEQIVHSDIKPDNIFFTDRSGDGNAGFPLYLHPVLGDFGLAVITSPDDPHNPDDLVDRGTPGFKAPEQHATRGEEGEEERVQVEKWGTKTNVWAIGVTMMAFMNRNSETGDLTFLEGDQVPQWRDIARGSEGYSGTLRRLAMRCVQYEQKDRINFQELRDQIDQCTGGVPGFKDYAEGMRFNSNAGSNDYPMFSEEPRDPYAVASRV